MRLPILRPLAVLVLSTGAWTSAVADTVYLKNGAWIDGIVRNRNTDAIQIEIGDIGKVEVPLEDVYEIEKNSRTGSRLSVSVDGRKLEVEVNPSRKATAPEAEVPTSDGREETADGSPADSSAPSSPGADSEREKSASGAEEEEKIDPELRKRIEGLVEDLQRQKSRFRVRAERHLKAVGAPAIPFLLPLVTDRSELVRVAVFRLFYTFGDDRVIPACIRALTDPNEYVRDYAHRALRRISGESLRYHHLASPARRVEGQRRWSKWWREEQELLKKLESDSRELE